MFISLKMCIFSLIKNYNWGEIHFHSNKKKGTFCLMFYLENSFGSKFGVEYNFIILLLSLLVFNCIL